MARRITKPSSATITAPGALRPPPFVLFLALAWALVAAQLFAEFWAATAVTFPDTDDAMRLVELRKFLAGGLSSWFDLHESRLGLPGGYDTHWSRLIDAGLAALFWFFRIFTDVAQAERLMAVTWPMLWLIPAFGGAAAIAWRLAGRDAAIVVLLLAIFSGPGIQQFRPGRIDHHNVQIALAILIVAATVWSDRKRWCAIAAGALTGFALAIGFESLLLLILCSAAFTLRFVFDAKSRRALQEFGLALAGGTLAAFLLTASPSRWTQSACDMIAANWAAGAIVAGLALAFVATLSEKMPRADSLLARLGLAALAGVVSMATFFIVEPRCLSGFFVAIDPAVKPIWLDNVSEMQSLFSLFGQASGTALATVAFPFTALVAAVMLGREKDSYREFGPFAALAAFLTALLYMVLIVRGASYAIWLGMPLIAAALLRLFALFQLHNLALRFAAALVVTPTALTLGAITLASAAGQPELTNLNPPERAGCTAKSSYTALADLRPGLMAINDVEWGPYMLAWTPHSVLAAPYHRLSPSIILSYRIFAEPPEKGRALATKAGIAYLVMCGQRGTVALSPAEKQASLWTRLQSGRAPGWLEPVKIDPASGFKVWKVSR